MNAAAAKNDGAELARLREQRAQLLREVERLRGQRNDALAAASDLQTENAQLRQRIAELEGNA